MPVAPNDDFCVSGGTPAVPVCDVLLTSSGWCDTAGLPVDVLYVRDCVSNVVSVSYLSPSSGAAVVPTFPLLSCSGGIEFSQLAICDIDPADGDVLGVYLIRTFYNPGTGVVTTTFINASTGLPYVPAGVPRFCGEGVDMTTDVICVEDLLIPTNPPFQVVLHTQHLGGSVVGNYITALNNTFAPLAGWGVNIVASTDCRPTIADSWGQVLVTNTTPFFSPAGMTSIDVIALDAGPVVTVNAGAPVTFRSTQSGSWSQDAADVVVKPVGYVSVTCPVGVQAYVTFQTRP